MTFHSWIAQIDVSMAWWNVILCSVDEAQKRDLIMAKQIRQSTTKILQRPSGTHRAGLLRITVWDCAKILQRSSVTHIAERNYAHWEIVPTAAYLRYSQSREKFCVLGDYAKILQRPSCTHRAEKIFRYWKTAPRYCKVPQVHTEQREILCIRRLRQDTAAFLR
jgi:hypothetical protein